MDKCPKCGGKVKVLERSLQYWGGVHCIAEDENFNSLQQLKAEIAALIPGIVTSFTLCDEKQFIALTNELRQLSAV